MEKDYPEELIWAPSYLGPQTGDGIADDGGQQASPHINNVNEVREFIDNVCDYLGVDVVDIISHSLGCTLAYAIFRGLKQGTPLEFNQPKKWHRVGTFVALAGAFHGLGPVGGGEWKASPGGAFMKDLLAENLGSSVNICLLSLTSQQVTDINQSNAGASFQGGAAIKANPS